MPVLMTTDAIASANGAVVSRTVTVASNVPTVWYTWVGFADASPLPVPSPKSHEYESACPSASLVPVVSNVTASGMEPPTGLTFKTAVGGVLFDPVYRYRRT